MTSIDFDEFVMSGSLAFYNSWNRY